MSKLFIRTTDKKGKVKERIFTERQAQQALVFMLKEFAKKSIIEKRIIEDGCSET